MTSASFQLALVNDGLEIVMFSNSLAEMLIVVVEFSSMLSFYL
jgi:hypothetical protein